MMESLFFFLAYTVLHSFFPSYDSLDSTTPKGEVDLFIQWYA